MSQTSAFCRAQETLQRDRASAAQLDNVRIIATQAATAWQREAVLAENREARQDRTALPAAASESEEDEDRLFG